MPADPLATALSSLAWKLLISLLLLLTPRILLTATLLISLLLLGLTWPVMLATAGNWMGPKALTWQFVAGVGMSCAVTALPILILLMEKLDVLRQPIGQRILRYASLDDLLIWSVLAVILMDWERVGRQLAFLAGFALATALFRRLMAWMPEREIGRAHV